MHHLRWKRRFWPFGRIRISFPKAFNQGLKRKADIPPSPGVIVDWGQLWRRGGSSQFSVWGRGNGHECEFEKMGRGMLVILVT